MKRLISIVLVLCLLLTGAATAIASEKGRVLKAITFYTGPGEAYPQLPLSQQVGNVVTVHTKVYDAASRSWWVQVEFNDGLSRFRVYAPAACLDVDLSRVPEETVLDGNAYLNVTTAGLCGPGVEYGIYDLTMDKFARCAVIEAENGHVLVEMIDGMLHRCWLPVDSVSSGYRFATEDTYSDSTLRHEGSGDPEGMAGTWCVVKAESANVRFDAGTEYAVAAYVLAHQAYEIKDSKYDAKGSTWYKIHVDGVDGWIAASLVTLDMTQAWTTKGGMANDPNWPIGQTVWIDVESGKLREGPGTQYEVAGYVVYGERYTVLDYDTALNGKKWYMVNQDGLIAWLSSGICELVQ